MGKKNKIYPELTYFLTMTIVDWVDVFTRPVYRNIIVESLNYCVKEKNLEIFGWVLMSNHYHLFLQTPELNLVAGMSWLAKHPYPPLQRAAPEVGAVVWRPI
jgi:REP element-mobilizing transposase RayT